MIKLFVYSLCHGSWILDFLKNNSNFNDKYETNYMANYSFRLNNDINTLDIIINQVKQSEIIIYQKVGYKHGIWSTDSILKNARPNCRLICIPNIYNTALFPLCKLGDYLGSKLFGEETIIKCINNGNNLDQIINEYKENTLDWNFSERFNDNIDRARKEELDANVKYIDFMIENHQNYQLFADALHPTNSIILFITNQILDLLELPGLRYDPYNPPIHSICDANSLSTPCLLHYNFNWKNNAIMTPNDSIYIQIITDIYNKYYPTDSSKSTEYTF